MTAVSGFQPHDQACAKIAAWRGRCMDLFGRGEDAISLALEAATASGVSLKIKHLAGQRTADLTALAAGQRATDKQRQAITGALGNWADVEVRRPYLAHGVVTALLDRHGVWHANFDFTAYRVGQAERCRWALSELEADEFETKLAEAFAALASQLGQFKGRLRR